MWLNRPSKKLTFYAITHSHVIILITINLITIFHNCWFFVILHMFCLCKWQTAKDPGVASLSQELMTQSRFNLAPHQIHQAPYHLWSCLSCSKLFFLYISQPLCPNVGPKVPKLQGTPHSQWLSILSVLRSKNAAWPRCFTKTFYFQERLQCPWVMLHHRAVLLAWSQESESCGLGKPANMVPEPLHFPAFHQD